MTYLTSLHNSELQRTILVTKLVQIEFFSLILIPNIKYSII